MKKPQFRSETGHRFSLHQPLHARQLLPAILLAAFSHGTALAADENIPTIDVSAPAQVAGENAHCTIADDKKLKSDKAATSDTAALLKNMPGLNLQGGGGVSSLPVVHGMADDRLRIKVDGMDLISACGNHMNPPLSYIDPANVGTAAVFAGIAPVSMGGDSIGGTVVVDSKDPEFAKSGEGILTKGEVGTFYRSNGQVWGGNASATVASENLSLSYRASTVKAENYKAGNDFKAAGLAAAGRGVLAADEVGSTMYKSTNHEASLATQFGNHMLDLKLGLQDIPYQGFVNQRMDMTLNDSKRANLRYEGAFDWGDLEARAYYENTKHAMQFGDDKLLYYNGMGGMNDGVACTPSMGMAGCAVGMPMDTEGVNIGATLKATIPLFEGALLRAGSEIQQYRLDDWWEPSGRMMWPNTFWNINGGERDRLALFAEWESTWGDRWLTQLGVRYEQVSMNSGVVQGYNATYATDAAAFNAADRNKSDNNIDVTALVRFTPASTATLEFGAAMKTRSPNLYERYTWSTGGMAMRMINMAGDGNGYVGNLNLAPEIAYTISTTIDLHDAKRESWGIKVTPYFTRIKDYIDVNRLAGTNTASTGFVYLQFANKSAQIHGVDVSGELALLRQSVVGGFSVTGILNYVRGENRTTGDHLYNIMPLNGKVALEHTLQGWSNSIEMEMVAAKTKVSQVRNEVPTSGYSLLNLRSSYAWKNVRFDFGIDNVLDKFYNHPLGGAYAGQGKTMSATGVAWGVPVPGMGRSFYAGVTVKM